MLGFYNYTVVLTYVGMLVGYMGILCAMGNQMLPALLCLMVSGVCDMFDGKIASTMVRTAQEKRFGVQIDSLSDLVCFGALPAAIVWNAAHRSLLACCLSGLYLLAALIRLAWFNVDEEERQNTATGPREYYLGLPVTTSALILPAVMALGLLMNWPLHLLGPVVLLITGLAFLTPFSLKKPGLPGKAALLLFGGAEAFILFKAWMIR